MIEIVLSIGFGVGIGWIASYYFAVRPLVHTQRDMRYQGFVFDRAPSKLRPVPDVIEITRNES